MNKDYVSHEFWPSLAHLVEECGEVLAAGGKNFRFGAFSVNPELPPDKQERNLDWLLRELDDLESAIGRFRTAAALYQAGGE